MVTAPPPRTNPCDDPDSLDRALQPCAFVLFGATGDLTHRKIVPALYSLHLQRLLPDPFEIVAFARRDRDDDSFRADMRAAVAEFAPSAPLDDDSWLSFARRVTYVRSTLDDPAGYERLKARLLELDHDPGLRGNRLFYLATPPGNFGEIVRHLAAAGLNVPGADGGWARLIIEKPFGHDLQSAHELNAGLGAAFHEDQIYRIDHYLGKETVQNLLVLRFANGIFEPLWNGKYIASVRITVAETLGMEGRGRYFDAAGITRDMVQNHALQVLTLIGMEPPISLVADAVRDEKVKVLRTMRPFRPDDVRRQTVRGQYGPGVIHSAHGDERVPGYREEEGVDAHSTTETYAAFRFAIDNWRWAGVPFYVQAGKRLAERSTAIEIIFKAIPDVLFARLACADVRPNKLTIRIQPDEGASLEIGSKVPGPEMRVQPVRMDFRYGASFDAPIRDAYERLLLDAIRGDPSLYARNDEVEAAWSVVTPILEAWQSEGAPPFPNYAAGTWGPDAAQDLLFGATRSS